MYPNRNLRMNRGGYQSHWRNRQERPNPNSQFIKLFYQILQALHHLRILTPQTLGNYRTNGFDQQVKHLDNFLKPAQSNPKLKKELMNLNRTWATKIAQTLCKHFTERISELLGQVVGLGFSEFVIKDLSNQALDWGKNNMRKKLRVETIQEYKKIIQSLLPVKSNDHTINQSGNNFQIPTKGIYKPPFINPRKTTPNKLPLTPVIIVNNRFQPLQDLDSQPSRTPSKRRISDSYDPNSIHTPKKQKKEGLENKKVRRSLEKNMTISPSIPIANGVTTALNSITKLSRSLSVPASNILEKVCRSSSPSPRRCRSPKRRSLSPTGSQETSPTIPKLTYAAVVVSPCKESRLTRHTNPKSEWDIPKITTADLIIGDSNVSRFTNLKDKEVQVEAYPGAKIKHMIELVKNYQYREKPKRVIIYVGTNERENGNTYLVSQSMKELLEVTRRRFPNSEIYVARIPISQILQSKKPTEAFNLSKLNEYMSKIQMEGVRVLYTGKRDEMSFHPDGVHWTPKSAQRILDGWFEQMSTFKQDFHQAQKTTVKI